MDVKKTINKTFDILFYIFLLACICLTINISKNTKQGEPPTLFGYKFYTVLTGSMSPTMNRGSLLVVKETQPKDIKVEDVITFGNNNDKSVTTHRVKEISNEDGIKFTTQGDANNTVDPEKVDGNLLVGKVVYHIPFLGATLEYIKSNIKIVLGGLILIMIITSIPNKPKNKEEANSVN